jgi:hypothetical protein
MTNKGLPLQAVDRLQNGREISFVSVSMRGLAAVLALAGCYAALREPIPRLDGDFPVLVSLPNRFKVASLAGRSEWYSVSPAQCRIQAPSRGGVGMTGEGDMPGVGTSEGCSGVGIGSYG